MTYFYSELSKRRLEGCHIHLQELFIGAIQFMDISIVCGHRGRLAQEHALKTGKSQLGWPDSKHNQEPSLAVDAAPYLAGSGIPWNDTDLFCMLAGCVLTLAQQKGLDITWGGLWSFKDYGHFELSL